MLYIRVPFRYVVLMIHLAWTGSCCFFRRSSCSRSIETPSPGCSGTGTIPLVGSTVRVTTSSRQVSASQ